MSRRENLAKEPVASSKNASDDQKGLGGGGEKVLNLAISKGLALGLKGFLVGGRGSLGEGGVE